MARKCKHCAYVEGSERQNPVQALLGAKPCAGREYLGHEWIERRAYKLCNDCGARFSTASSIAAGMHSRSTGHIGWQRKTEVVA